MQFYIVHTQHVHPKASSTSLRQKAVLATLNYFTIILTECANIRKYFAMRNFPYSKLATHITQYMHTCTLSQGGGQFARRAWALWKVDSQAA